MSSATYNRTSGNVKLTSSNVEIGNAGNADKVCNSPNASLDMSTPILAQNRTSASKDTPDASPFNVIDTPANNIIYVPQGSSLVATNSLAVVDSMHVSVPTDSILVSAPVSTNSMHVELPAVRYTLPD